MVDSIGPRIRRRGRVLLAAGTAALALPATALAAVPAASWYWALAAPTASTKVLLLGTSTGVYRSSDGGKTWHASGLAGVDTTSLVRSGSSVYAGGVRAPATTKGIVTVGGVYVVAPGAGVLAVSADGGSTWRTLHPKGLPELAVQALAVDPAHASVLYAVLRNGALYRSTDGARSFALVTRRVGGTPWALAVTAGGRLVAGDMTTGAFLERSPTQWEHTPFSDPRGSQMVMEYAVQPGSPSHLVMSSYGVVRSTNGGESWSVALRSKVMFGPVAYASSKVAYAVGWDRSVWRSGDGGATWTRVP